MTAGNFCQCRFRLPLIPLRLLVRSPDDSCSGHAAFFTCKHYCTSLSANMTGASALLCTRRFSFTVRAPGQSTQSFTTPISFKLSCWFAAKRALLSTEFFAAAPNCIWPTTGHGLFPTVRADRSRRSRVSSKPSNAFWIISNSSPSPWVNAWG